MWICTTCGEPHQDQFKECWKCAGAEPNEHITAEPPKLVPVAPLPERKLRPFGSILARALVGFLIGAVLSLSSFNFVNADTIVPNQPLSPAGRTALALLVGAIFAIVVGLFFWVVLPYEPLDTSRAEVESLDQPH